MADRPTTRRVFEEGVVVEKVVHRRAERAIVRIGVAVRGTTPMAVRLTEALPDAVGRDAVYVHHDQSPRDYVYDGSRLRFEVVVPADDSVEVAYGVDPPDGDLAVPEAAPDLAAAVELDGTADTEGSAPATPFETPLTAPEMSDPVRPDGLSAKVLTALTGDPAAADRESSGGGSDGADAAGRADHPAADGTDDQRDDDTDVASGGEWPGSAADFGDADGDPLEGWVSPTRPPAEHETDTSPPEDWISPVPEDDPLRPPPDGSLLERLVTELTADGGSPAEATALVEALRDQSERPLASGPPTGAITDRVDELESELTALQSAHETAVAELRADVAELQSDLDELAAALEATDTALAELSTDHEEDIETVSGAVTSLRRSLDELQPAIEAVEDRLDDDVAALASDVEATRRAVRTLHEEVESLEEIAGFHQAAHRPGTDLAGSRGE